MEMGEISMEEKMSYVLSNCMCEKCSSYKNCSAEGGKKELGFCFPKIGKSVCITEEKGCICGSCPVYSKLGLRYMYYCTRGSEKDQMAM